MIYKSGKRKKRLARHLGGHLSTRPCYDSSMLLSNLKYKFINSKKNMDSSVKLLQKALSDRGHRKCAFRIK